MTLRPRILDPAAEQCDPAARQTQQQRILREGVARLKGTGCWAQHLAGASPEDPLPDLPLLGKATLLAAGPLGMLAVERSRVVRVHASSGTTAEPLIVGYTAGDLALWSRLVARGLAAVGLTAGTVVHSALGYGLFTGGLGFHAAAESLGAQVIPAAAGRTARHLRLLAALRPEVLFATPSYAMHLAAHSPPPVAVGVFGAEPWSEALRARLEAAWGMVAYDTYGLSEIIGPGVAFECPARQGMHLNEDAFIAEIIDPAGRPLPEGEIGELVLTALTKEAMPLLRYRTGDRTALDRSPCPCGRTLARMQRIVGRVDDMLVVRGVNVFPGQIEAALLTLPALSAAWQVTVRQAGALAALEVAVECATPQDAGLARRAEQVIADILGLSVAVRLLPPGGLPHGGGKAQRVVDNREQ